MSKPLPFDSAEAKALALHRARQALPEWVAEQEVLLAEDWLACVRKAREDLAARLEEAQALERYDGSLLQGSLGVHIERMRRRLTWEMPYPGSLSARLEAVAPGVALSETVSSDLSAHVIIPRVVAVQLGGAVTLVDIEGEPRLVLEPLHTPYLLTTRSEATEWHFQVALPGEAAEVVLVRLRALRDALGKRHAATRTGLVCEGSMLVDQAWSEGFEVLRLRQ